MVVLLSNMNSWSSLMLIDLLLGVLPDWASAPAFSARDRIGCRLHDMCGVDNRGVWRFFWEGNHSGGNPRMHSRRMWIRWAWDKRWTNHALSCHPRISSTQQEGKLTRMHATGNPAQLMKHFTAEKTNPWLNCHQLQWEWWGSVQLPVWVSLCCIHDSKQHNLPVVVKQSLMLPA